MISRISVVLGIVLRVVRCNLPLFSLFWLTTNTATATTSSCFLSLPFQSRRNTSFTKQSIGIFAQSTSHKKGLAVVVVAVDDNMESKVYGGKCVMITGATGGLGKALALELCRYKVGHLVLSGRDENALKIVGEECRQSLPSITVEYLIGDLANPNDVERMANQIRSKSNEKDENSRSIDILINNGGVSSRSNFLETDIAIDAKIMQINFLSGAALAKAVIPGMMLKPQQQQQRQQQQKGGRIIWISSIQGRFALPERSSYAASKFAVQGYTESIRAELYPHNIHVHTISPGYIRTGLSRNAFLGNGQAYGKMDTTTENGAPPEEVAQQILQKVAAGKVDFTVALNFSAWIAQILRFLFPDLFRWILVRRYEKSRQTQIKNNNKQD